MENFHFALSTVGDMKTQRMITFRVDRRPGAARFRQRTQVEDVVLQLAEQAALTGRAEQVDAFELLAVTLRLVVLIQQVDVVTPLLAPGSEQRLPVLVHVLLLE